MISKLKNSYDVLIKLNPVFLVIIILVLIGLGMLLSPVFIKLVKEKFKSKKNEYHNIFETLKRIESLLSKNNEGTKACLYSNLDNILTKAETLGNVWSANIQQIYENMKSIYLDLGDGIDEGKSLISREEKITTDDTVYFERIARYNNYKKGIFMEEIK